MSKRKERDEKVPEYETLPNGQIKVAGELLKQLRANKLARAGLAEVHNLTVAAAYDAAEKCMERINADMQEWWATVIVAAGLDPETHYTVDASTGVISIMEDEEGEVPPDAPPILHELVRTLRESGVETLVKKVSLEPGENEPKPPAKPN